MQARVLTGQGLTSGRVLWLTRDGGWSPRLAEARVAHTESDIAEMEADGTAAHAAHEVFEIYLVDVVEDPEGLRPVKYRELLRARGPTVHPQFGPQAEQGGQAS